MLNFEDAFEIVIASAIRLGTEQVDIGQALGRILAQDVVSDIDMPPFNKSAMDGFACRREDSGDILTVIETIAAGYVPQKTIGHRQCAKIMTGAIVPEAADCVIMVEYTKTIAENQVRFTGEKTADNICYKAEDVKAGDCMIRKGTRLRAEHIAVLASVGCTNPLISLQPRVGIIATGNELVEPAKKPGNAQIRNSNSYQLAAQAASMGALPCYYGIAADTEQTIDVMLKKAMAESDVVLISGGVSAGDFDLVPKILRENNIKLVFEKVAIKPGKPTVFGIADDGFVFGLPGNPVSGFVLFEIMVKPFLYKMMGNNFEAVTFTATLGKTILRKNTKRISLIPVAFEGPDKVMPVEYHGSAHINALCQADGIITIPAGTAEIKEGTTVNVRQI